jgi:hypothetical protein
VVRVNDPTDKGLGKEILPKEITSKLENVLVKSLPPKDFTQGSTLLCSGSDPLSSPRLSASQLYSAKEKYLQGRGEIQNHGENPEPKPKTKGDLKFEQAHGGISRKEWDSHDEPWKAQKCIDLGISKEGVSEFKPHGNGHGQTNVSLPKKEAKAKAKPEPDWRGVPYSDMDLELDDFGDKITGETEATRRARLAKLFDHDDLT